MTVASHRDPGSLVANIAALSLAALVLVCGAIMFATDTLELDTPRGFYFAYVIALLLAVVAIPWPRLKTVLVLFAAFEATLGLGGHLTGLASLLPEDGRADGRFRWHPLLQATPQPSIEVSMSGGRVLRHSSEGTRGLDRTPEELKNKSVIAVFGGSSTYDVALAEGETWADRLEAELGTTEFAVINHGVPGYSTAEHLVQTAFYQKKFGTLPNCAVYYVGWNDIQNAHIANLDPGYADFHLVGMVDALRTRRVAGATVEVSPAFTLLLRMLSNEFDTVRYTSSIAGEIKTGSDTALEEIFASNVRAISAINRDRQIHAIWIGQLLNRSALEGEGQYGWFPFVRDRDVWPLQARFNEVLRDAARSGDDSYIDVPIEAFDAADFADQGHFSAAGAAKFAERIAPAIRKICRSN